MSFYYIVFKLYIFIFIILNINSFQYFRAYTLLSKDILFISEEGIIKYLIDTNNQITITSTDDITFENENILEFISFSQSDDGKYILCRIKNYIYIISNDDNTLIISKNINLIENCLVDIKYYKEHNINYFIISFINEDKKIQLQKYIFSDTKVLLKAEKIKEIPNKDGTEGVSFQNGISCELMYSNEYDNNLLICFVENNLNYLIALEFDPKNNLEFIDKTIYNNANYGASHIKSIMTSNKYISFICYIKINFECILYNSQKKVFSDTAILNEYFYGVPYDFELNYIKDKKDYYIYLAWQINELYLYQYDEFLKINQKLDNDDCYSYYEIKNCNQKYSSIILYNKDKYSIFYSCKDGGNINLKMKQ